MSQKSVINLPEKEGGVKCTSLCAVAAKRMPNLQHLSKCSSSTWTSVNGKLQDQSGRNFHNADETLALYPCWRDMNSSVIKRCFRLISSLINICGFQLQMRKCTRIHSELRAALPIHASRCADPFSCRIKSSLCLLEYYVVDISS